MEVRLRALESPGATEGRTEQGPGALLWLGPPAPARLAFWKHSSALGPEQKVSPLPFEKWVQALRKLSDPETLGRALSPLSSGLGAPARGML